MAPHATEILVEPVTCDGDESRVAPQETLTAVRAARFTLAAPTIVSTTGEPATALLLPRGSQFDLPTSFRDGNVQVAELPPDLEVDHQIALVDAHGREIAWSMLRTRR